MGSFKKRLELYSFCTFDLIRIVFKTAAGLLPYYCIMGMVISDWSKVFEPLLAGKEKKKKLP